MTGTYREVFVGSRMESARRLMADRRGKMPVSELAQLAQLPLNRIRQFEAGQRLPDQDELIAIAKATGRDVTWFFPPADRTLTREDMKD